MICKSCCSIIFLCWIKRKGRFLLTIPSNSSRTKTCDIMYNIFPIIKVTNLIEINETNQQKLLLLTIMYPKLNDTLNILKYPLCYVPMALMGHLHILGNNSNIKEDIRRSIIRKKISRYELNYIFLTFKRGTRSQISFTIKE